MNVDLHHVIYVAGNQHQINYATHLAIKIICNRIAYQQQKFNLVA